jgi:hypothetical protein
MLKLQKVDRRNPVLQHTAAGFVVCEKTKPVPLKSFKRARASTSSRCTVRLKGTVSDKGSFNEFVPKAVV